MIFIHSSLLLTFCSSSECKGEDKVIQPTGDVTAAEGQPLTLDCTYLFWYKQEVNSFLKFMLRRSTFGSGDNAAEFQKEGFDAEVNKTSVPLKIQKLQLAHVISTRRDRRQTQSLDLKLMKTELQSLPHISWSSHLLNRAHMESLLLSLLLAAVCLESRAQKDNVLQPEGEVTAAEGETETLSCLYNSTQTDVYIYWYKQDGTNRPNFILSTFTFGSGKTEEEFKERFTSRLDSTLRSVPLKIQKLQLSDSAVYYCALQPTVTGNNTTLY
ncbi:uncharacterized protein LOC142988129 [Genypterus blacodes]|uniref:uncharacterized protein LOC142988129 n=1 Tax=Genypterus blacodes TaxID=154954 RepID=UPI003F757A86